MCDVKIRVTSSSRQTQIVRAEILRKYPPAPLLSRRCEYKYQIPGSKVVLPAGMRVVIPIYGLHHDPNYYPEPMTFKPERFTEENKRTRHPYTYLPFGEGPRNCIGKDFNSPDFCYPAESRSSPPVTSQRWNLPSTLRRSVFFGRFAKRKKKFDVVSQEK